MEMKEALARIELRLRLLCCNGMTPEQRKWIDDTRLIAQAAFEAAGGDAVDDGPTATAEPAKRDYSKFLTVAPGVTLSRFRGGRLTKLIAKRVGSSGNADVLFEICVDRKECAAEVYRDERLLFTIIGETVGQVTVEEISISALKRRFKRQRKHNSKRRHAAAEVAA